LFPNRVLIKSTTDIYNQFWEYRYSLGLSFGKNFSFHKQNTNNTGIYTSINTDYSFGTFIGSTTKPQSLFLFNPEIGIFYKFNNIKIKIGYDYEKFNTLKVSNHFVVTGIYYHFGNKQTTDQTKYLYN
ncbi:MAG: hypothetical protein GXO79_04305, partial [Chlorobi bacterium]|nr:hypothetical protein [Chlorobiota bacterium]